MWISSTDVLRIQIWHFLISSKGINHILKLCIISHNSASNENVCCEALLINQKMNLKVFLHKLLVWAWQQQSSCSDISLSVADGVVVAWWSWSKVFSLLMQTTTPFLTLSAHYPVYWVVEKCPHANKYTVIVKVLVMEKVCMLNCAFGKESSREQPRPSCSFWHVT